MMLGKDQTAISICWSYTLPTEEIRLEWMTTVSYVLYPNFHYPAGQNTCAYTKVSRAAHLCTVRELWQLDAQDCVHL